MRSLSFLASLLTLALPGVAAPSIAASDTSLAGDWSEVRDGIRGRLAFTEAASAPGQSRTGVIYLDLQNVSAGQPRCLYFAPANSPVRCTLRTAKGEEIPPTGSEYSGAIPSPCWLTLPADSVLRVRVTLGGFGVPAEPGLFVAGQIPDGWLLPAGSAEEYLLSASVTIADPKEPGDGGKGSAAALPIGGKSWQGRLDLPALRIAPNAAPAPYEIVIESEPREIVQPANR